MLVYVYASVNFVCVVDCKVLGQLVDIAQVVLDQLLQAVDVFGPVLGRWPFEVSLHVWIARCLVHSCCRGFMLFKFVHDVYQNECHTYEKGWYQTKPLIECFQPSNNRYDPKSKKLVHSHRHVRFELLCVGK